MVLQTPPRIHDIRVVSCARRSIGVSPDAPGSHQTALNDSRSRDENFR
jgi:hypothetical protein